MSDSNPKRDVVPEKTRPRNVDPTDPGTRYAEAGMDPREDGGASGQAGSGGRERTNPHDEEGAPATAARTAGAMSGMFFTVVILAVVAVALILYLAFFR
ncbi:MAG TPA: hypothetical protein VD789_07020 [Thermomicrobiales bacterium]|nr:hypothetical protein [Thermomicrobiales bacterium]